jgi:hypothetical protein
MNNPNPSAKLIDITTQEGLDLLKIKAKYYGHYADNLKVLELIKEIEYLRANTPEAVEEALREANKKFWE